MQVTKTGDWKNTIYKALKIIKGIYSVYVKGEKYTGTCGILVQIRNLACSLLRTQT